ncbi:MAG: response regulator transcription factor [Candidatus Gracilibacteria bacterium]|nr:response regulator transcription factor [Candidatus Gracilibacteria bacterium]
MEKILIIEDDLGISTSLKLYLENSNFIAEVYNSGEGAIEKIKDFNPDLIILDINLPVKNGIEICKEVRDFSQVPIIMLTAKASENDRITGFDIGADDYIAKPFSPRELLARIKVVLRRSDTKEEDTEMLKYRDINIDLNKKIVKIGGKQITLTKNEYELLERLLRENGKLLTREILMTEVLGYDKYVYDRTLDTHIKNLRKKLGEDDIILTVRGEGYRLNK